MNILWPKSPEPTAVLSGCSFAAEADGAGGSAVAEPSPGGRRLGFRG